jgi:hypothetical protein
MKYAALALMAALATTTAAEGDMRDPVISFIEPIYRHLDRIDPATVPYAPALADLIRRDRAVAKASGAAGILGWMPLCGCQDLDRYHLRAIQGRKTSRFIRAVVTFQIALQTQSVTLDIVRIGGALAIADIHSVRVPSLRAYLAREVPREEARLRSQPPLPRSPKLSTNGI